MKRKLIKRNKQFLSSRYRVYLDGNGAFQKLTCHTMYDDDSGLIYKHTRYYWKWFYRSSWLDVVIRNVEIHSVLEETSALDQELGLYD